MCRAAVAVAVAVAVAAAGAGAICLARFASAVSEDSELCASDDLGLIESLTEMFLVRAAVAAALQSVAVVARGVDCIVSGCDFLDVMALLEEVLVAVGGGDGVGGDDVDDDGDDEDGCLDDENGGDGGEALDAP